jgi:hypothetical protein
MKMCILTPPALRWNSCKNNIKICFITQIGIQKNLKNTIVA